MHDGQNLFDASLSFTGVPWAVDRALVQIMAATGHTGTLVVGIWNTAERRREYLPERPFRDPGAAVVLEQFCEINGGLPFSDAYLRFIVDDLKPLIDQSYRTLSDQANTMIMGSSMGGLISLYALTEYPTVFGGAGCLSTHWPIGGEVLVDYFGKVLPAADQHRLYFDYGTRDLDAAYEPYQLRFDQYLAAAGYRRGHNWMTEKFVGAGHSEQAWQDRVQLPLRFLLRQPTSSTL
jgi:predicted alpha/beta superfamily hydrolase